MVLSLPGNRPRRHLGRRFPQRDPRYGRGQGIPPLRPVGLTQVEPERVTTDGHTSYPKAIADELGTDVDHRTSQYKNNVIEQDHRGIKGRYRSMRGFKNFDAAHRFCRAFNEIRNFLRSTCYINQTIPLARRRVIHMQRVVALRDLISAV